MCRRRASGCQGADEWKVLFCLHAMNESEAARFPADLFSALMKETHVVVWAVYSGSCLGEPKMRKRFRGAAIKKSRLLWLGRTVGNVTEDRGRESTRLMLLHIKSNVVWSDALNTHALWSYGQRVCHAQRMPIYPRQYVEVSV